MYRSVIVNLVLINSLLFLSGCGRGNNNEGEEGSTARSGGGFFFWRAGGGGGGNQGIVNKGGTPRGGFGRTTGGFLGS